MRNAIRMGVALAALTVTSAGWAQTAPPPADDPLAEGFREPPQSARPRVWWHWMNGNVTQEGVRKDLEWMKRAGIGGLTNFDASLMTPQIVDHRIVYMTPEWKQVFRYTAGLADKLGLEMAIAASPGWSETGGPWVAPRDGLKKLVWSEALVAGGKRFTGPLAAPPAVTGAFQDLHFDDPLAAFEGGKGHKPPAYYADVAVLAWPVGAAPAASPQALSGTGTPLDAAALTDASLQTVAQVERGTPEAPASLALRYPAPRTMRSVTFFMPGALPPFGDPEYLPVLEAQGPDGWRKVAEIPLASVPTSVSFAPVTASAFRIVLGPNIGAKRVGLGEGAPGVAIGGIFPPPPAAGKIAVGEFSLSPDPRIDRFEAKAGFAVARDYYALSPALAPDTGVAPAKVIDLTGKLKPDGTLDWSPPKGEWRVLRLGYSLLGTTNHPAPPEATGLEVDKYDGAAVRAYLETYLGMYRDAAGADLLGKAGVRALLTDSIEVGASNWTPKLVERFKALRGYDPIPWLPTLTGTIIGSRADSDAFLYDFRRTLADLIASEHYGTVATVAHEHGLKVYGEALEDLRPSLGDDMTMRSHADVPMAAMWTYNRGGAPRPTLLADMRGAASVAHLYGQNLAAAESLTSAFSPWAHAPADLRRVIDLEFANGINRPVIHTSVHQPVDDKVPGLSLAIFGQYFNRHETWAEMARPWMDYIARSSFLLQQGRNVADVAYFYGEEAPLTSMFGDAPIADAPLRHAYDFVSADALRDVLKVSDGDLTAARGARYKLLYLGGSSRRMTLATLQRIATLVEGGATVAGDAPVAAPGLGNDATAFSALTARMWSGQPVTTFGKGRVIAGRDVEAALATIGVRPDFSAPGSEILFVHRQTADADIYFVDNRRNRAETVEARFRVAGRQPEIWHADTGRSEAVSWRSEGGDTVVPLDFAPEDSFFVVFRKPATGTGATVAKAIPVPLGEIGGVWTVTFQPNRGAPAGTTLDRLASLSENPLPGIKYFSGIATYANSFTAPKGWKPGAPLWLDLGQVGDLAEVRINGKPAGTAWHAPYRLDIGQLVKPGRNSVEIRVANLWVNRLIGDAQPGAAKVTYTTMPTYRPDAPLRPSGLIGPVRLTGEK